MTLLSVGAPDFKQIVKSNSANDIVTTSTGSSSISNKVNTTEAKITQVAAGTGQQLSNLAIADGYAILIKALHANTGLIRIAKSAANAIDPTKAFELTADQFLTLRITNLNELYMDADVTGEGICYIVESDT